METTRPIPVLLALFVVATAAGCGGGAPEPAAVASPAVTTGPPASPRSALAARAAAAEDNSVVATYTLTGGGGAPRAVIVTFATDRSWRVDIAGGAMGGLADVSVAVNGDGLFQCALPSETRPVSPVCIRITDPDGALPKHIDPRVQHAFTDWRAVLTDREAPLSVSLAKPVADGVAGQCYAVESTYASLDAPLDTGIYCYNDVGVLTGAKLSFGTLALTQAPVTGPGTITLPGPVTTGPALGMATPPPQTSTPSAGTPVDG
ncbi:hypothetical protein J2S43_007248 [Catenuloplanes nepalensis]|uniref:Lipoprotein n=1 Tax=Catenuloplanes nepalensis TaxID=587533 RepID=A0ABT9N5N5_9ACTN|nr:hypothetical protein [Catenuloplanes nepalensis]MDP9798736.1 hypothetical protein [Catenuloplanes nepalensis]